MMNIFNYKSFLLIIPFVLAGCGHSATNTEDITMEDETIELAFVNHLKADLAEQDVFVMHEGDTEGVYRVTPEEKEQYMDAQLYSTAEYLPHDPSEKKNFGPYPKGEALDMTLADWLAAEGTAQIQCDNGRGTLKAEFSNLAPKGVYTMWYVFSPRPPASPFTTLDLPLGDRDGSMTKFTADAEGNATYEASGFEPCLQLSGVQLKALLGIAWHPGGDTHGSSPGEFGKNSHVQIFTALPDAE